MIVDPYKLHPVVPTIALLTPEGRAVSEQGELLDLDDWPADVRLWASYETVYALVRSGVGEALCWNHEEIRWRHRRFEEDWKRRPSDANVIKLPFDHLGVDKALSAFAQWRDWLGMYGASPTGTSGSAAWSLLRARLERRLVTNTGERPPLLQTTGGRQELGPKGQGRFAGTLELLDLPAAYASTLASLRYGGVWLEADGSHGRELERYAGSDTPCFVRARVRIPDLQLGPLVQRSRRRTHSYMEAMLLGNSYPTGRTLQGVWTWEEIAAAEACGCVVEKVLGGWIHRSGWRPFAPWWDAIQAGRAMPGLAGQLAKVTGNALWGRFAMDPRVAGERTIRSRNGKLVARPLVSRPFPWPAHDLAETVAGRVRARLYLAMMAAGPNLVSAHTDGLWVVGSAPRQGETVSRQAHNLETAGSTPAAAITEDGWRLKQQARRLELLSPQNLRYWPRPPRRSEPWVVYAGVPAGVADLEFEKAWRKAAL